MWAASVFRSNGGWGTRSCHPHTHSPMGGLHLSLPWVFGSSQLLVLITWWLLPRDQALSVMFSSFQFWQVPITWTLRMGHLMSSWSLLAMETSLPWSPVLYPALKRSFLPYPSDKRCFVRVCVGSCTQGIFFCTVDKGFSSILSVAIMALCLHLKWQSLLFLPVVYIKLLLF